MHIVTDKTVTQLLRRKGLQPMTEFSAAVGVNRVTLMRIMQSQQSVVRQNTYDKICNYLADARG